MSSSLPAEIQVAFMQTIPGLEHCKMMRAAMPSNMTVWILSS